MARIPRKTAKIFGVAAGAVPGGIGVFGSLAAGLPVESVDLSVIQAATEWSLGWGGALVNHFPAQEDMNSIPFVLSQQIAEILQDGIPPYDAGTTYFTNSLCMSGNILYISLVDNNVGNTPISSPTQWSNYSGNVFPNELYLGATGNLSGYTPAGWSASVFNLILFQSGGAANINLFDLPPTSGQLITIMNNGVGAPNTITIKHNNGGPNANGFLLKGGADAVIPALAGGTPALIQVYYSARFVRWVEVSRTF